MFLKLLNIVSNLSILTFSYWGPLGKRVQITPFSTPTPQSHIPVKELSENKSKRLDLRDFFKIICIKHINLEITLNFIIFICY